MSTLLWITVFPLIEAGSQIQTGSLIEAGGLTAFVPIEAGSLIQARSLIEAGGLTANTIQLMVLVIGLWCIASFVTYYSTYWYLIMASDVQKR